MIDTKSNSLALPEFTKPLRDDATERSWMNHLKESKAAAEREVPKKKPPSKFLQRLLREHGVEGLLNGVT